MEFDPLELFTPEPSTIKNGFSETNDSFGSLASNNISHPQKRLCGDQKLSNKNGHVENEEITDDDGILPIHIHDLPLLRCKPPPAVLISFLRLFSPQTSLNFAPRDVTRETHAESANPHIVFAEKNVEMDQNSWNWLKNFCPRFDSEAKLASIPGLAEAFKKTYASQYNAWLTQLISSDFAWISEQYAAEIQSLTALRIAENCGRTAQPEIMRAIKIPSLPRKLWLKEPSLTSDNLGLKTWGSSFILGCRLASQQQKKYLLDPVLELGAGTGLVGMVACCLGYASVLTDLAEIVPNLRKNTELNKIKNAEVAELDWSNPSKFFGKFGRVKYSTIILSDPLYSSQHPPWIVNMINLLLSDDKGARVLLQIPVRKSFEEERAHLWRLMDANGYAVEEECEESGYDDFGESSFIFRKYVRRDPN